MGKISDAHSSLFHYTTWEGLKGIIESNTLFATHARFLNDSSEMLQAADLLIRLMVPEVIKFLPSLPNQEAMRDAIKRDGSREQFCNGLVHHIVTSFYEVTGPDFYVCSFFGTPPDPYTKKNGLLSQWRGYGKQQGFVIEFDTLKLEQLHEQEGKSYYHAFGAFGDVVYGDTHPLYSDDFLPCFDKLKLYILNNLKKDAGEEIEVDPFSGFTPFCYCTSMLKHVGFKEEKEVRIVSSPLTTLDGIDNTKSELGPSNNVIKKIHSRTKNFSPIPFIKLFDFEHEGLPITRIIVGPSKDKEDVAFAVRKLLGSKFLVDVCETPFE